MKFSDSMNQKERLRITVIGLGLMGGSMAMAIRGFRDAVIGGVDTDPKILEKASIDGTIDIAYHNASEAAAFSDLIILCVYPRHIVEFMSQNARFLKKGSLICDVCGAKSRLYTRIAPLIPEGVDYIGIHPMAGKETGGFDNADSRLFINAGFIVTPLPSTRPESLEFMKELAVYIRARATVSEPVLHDEIIAYTSDLMHISAAALCMSFHPEMTGIYTAGAYRDCTRVASINPDLWSELLLLNGDAIIPCLNTYIGYLEKLKRAIKSEDKQELYRLLELAGKNKKEMLAR